jgi:hypothetical protein
LLSALFGSLPTLRLTHTIENKEIRVNIDLRRIPRKMLDKPGIHLRRDTL